MIDNWCPQACGVRGRRQSMLLTPKGLLTAEHEISPSGGPPRAHPWLQFALCLARCERFTCNEKFTMMNFAQSLICDPAVKCPEHPPWPAVVSHPWVNKRMTVLTPRQQWLRDDVHGVRDQAPAKTSGK
ncbi:hypothetical protein [Micromonospora carbonacea]|uniref:hypothetical protein n=1 Tax=Micromonospora carbonacea TaxID=47853 RepID=UPI003D7415F7